MRHVVSMRGAPEPAMEQIRTLLAQYLKPEEVEWVDDSVLFLVDFNQSMVYRTVMRGFSENPWAGEVRPWSPGEPLITNEELRAPCAGYAKWKRRRTAFLGAAAFGRKANPGEPQKPIPVPPDLPQALAAALESGLIPTPEEAEERFIKEGGTVPKAPDSVFPGFRENAPIPGSARDQERLKHAPKPPPAGKAAQPARSGGSDGFNLAESKRRGFKIDFEKVAERRQQGNYHLPQTTRQIPKALPTARKPPAQRPQAHERPEAGTGGSGPVQFSLAEASKSAFGGSHHVGDPYYKSSRISLFATQEPTPVEIPEEYADAVEALLEDEAGEPVALLSGPSLGLPPAASPSPATGSSFSAALRAQAPPPPSTPPVQPAQATEDPVNTLEALTARLNRAPAAWTQGPYQVLAAGQQVWISLYLGTSPPTPLGTGSYADVVRACIAHEDKRVEELAKRADQARKAAAAAVTVAAPASKAAAPPAAPTPAVASEPAAPTVVAAIPLRPPAHSLALPSEPAPEPAPEVEADPEPGVATSAATSVTTSVEAPISEERRAELLALLDLSVPKLAEALQGVSLRGELALLLQAEEDGKTRKGAIGLLRAMIAQA